MVIWLYHTYCTGQATQQEKEPAGVTSWATLSDFQQEEGRKEMFYLMTHSTHFIYGYMESDIW